MKWKHQWAGANSQWQKGIWQLWKEVKKDTSFNADQTYQAADSGAEMLGRAAALELAIVNNRLQVKVINNTGAQIAHRLCRRKAHVATGDGVGQRDRRL